METHVKSPRGSRAQRHPRSHIPCPHAHTLHGSLEHYTLEIRQPNGRLTQKAPPLVNQAEKEEASTTSSRRQTTKTKPSNTPPSPVGPWKRLQLRKQTCARQPKWVLSHRRNCKLLYILQVPSHHIDNSLSQCTARNSGVALSSKNLANGRLTLQCMSFRCPIGATPGKFVAICWPQVPKRASPDQTECANARFDIGCFADVSALCRST